MSRSNQKTRPSSVSLWARLAQEITIPTLIVAALVAVVSTLGALEVLRDVYTDNPIAFLGIAAPAATGAWMTIELCWTKKGQPILPRFSIRAFVLGGAFIIVQTVIHAFVTWQPAQAAYEAYPDQYSNPISAWLGTFGAFDLLGYAASLGGSTAGLLLVTLPYFVVFKPRQFANANMEERPRKRDLATTRVGGLALVVVLNLVFAVPSFVIFGDQYDNDVLVVVGWLLIPLGVVAVIIAALAQRPDRARRKAAGLRR